MRHQAASSSVESHIPVPGYWYINASGELIRVRLIGYDGSIPSTALIQYVDGTTCIIEIDDWQGLDILMPADEYEALRRESDRQ